MKYLLANTWKKGLAFLCIICHCQLVWNIQMGLLILWWNYRQSCNSGFTKMNVDVYLMEWWIPINIILRVDVLFLANRNGVYGCENLLRKWSFPAVVATGSQVGKLNELATALDEVENSKILKLIFPYILAASQEGVLNTLPLALLMAVIWLKKVRFLWLDWFSYSWSGWRTTVIIRRLHWNHDAPWSNYQYSAGKQHKSYRSSMYEKFYQKA